MKSIKSVMIRMNLCPGDCLMLTSAVRDLKNACPDLGINVETKCPDVWENNPYLDRSITAYKADKLIYAEYDLIRQSNQAPFHFIHGFRMNLAKQLDTVIPAGPFKVDLHFTDEEKETMSYDDVAYLILNDKKKKIKIQDLFKKVIKVMGLPESEYEEGIGDFFELITTDKRFIRMS